MLQHRRALGIFFVHAGAHIKPLRIILPSPGTLSGCSAFHRAHGN
ncbi:Unknown protein sequence [Pseudomonas amygdali pv. myricae]|nr:Unknown protein sequence [Pseudomonas syringae pv. aceris]KPB52979.1 Unknown protein sequence [Pseudomonas amygdali pv. myricae]